MVMLTSVAGVKAQQTGDKALAEELLNLMNAKENVEKSFAMIKQMVPAQIARMSGTLGQSSADASAVTDQVDKIMEMVTKELNWDNLKGDFVALYANTFNDEEMKGIIAFLRSPAGEAFTKKQPELMRRSMGISQKLMMQMTPKIQAMVKEAATPGAPKPPESPQAETAR
jgi:hypothetical protein